MRPVTRETDTPRATAPRTAAHRPVAKHQVSADEGAVDVEGKQADREDAAAAPSGRRDAGVDRPRPAGSPPGRARPATSSPAERGQRAPPSRRPGRSRSRSIAAPSGAEDLGRRASRRPMSPSPSAPPSRATSGSNDAATGSVGTTSRPDVGQVREEHVERRGDDGRQEVGDGEPHHVGDAVANRVLLASSSASSENVSGDDRDVGLPRRASAARRPATPRSCRRPCRRRRPERRRPGRPRRRRQPRDDLLQGEVDEGLRLGPRDQGAGVDREGQPVELLEPADVGHGLAGQTPYEIALERRGRSTPTGASGCATTVVRSTPTAWPEQQLGVSRALSDPASRSRADGRLEERAAAAIATLRGGS